MTACSISFRWLPVAAAGFLVASSCVALADCQEDLGKLMAKRTTAMEALNKMNSGGKKQLDPIAACPKLKGLTAIENEVVSYLEKNKEWCNVPENFLDQAKAGRAKTAAFATKACQVAAQVQKMKEQQAQGGGQFVQKLPTGPL